MIKLQSQDLGRDWKQEKQTVILQKRWGNSPKIAGVELNNQGHSN